MDLDLLLLDLDLKRHPELHHVIEGDHPRLAVVVRQHLQGAVHPSNRQVVEDAATGGGTGEGPAQVVNNLEVWTHGVNVE